MAKEKTGHALRCAACGGAWGTLVKKGDKYQHARVGDCMRHRAAVKAKVRREEVLKQAQKGVRVDRKT